MEQKKNGSKKTKSKLFMALIAGLVALVVLGGATFAWLTLSTNPEISGIKATVEGRNAIQVSLNNKDYSVSQKLPLGGYAPLIPVSTIDGLNWFVCKYDVSGDVLQTVSSSYQNAQYSYLRFPDGSNISKNETTVYKADLGNNSKQIVSYYVYTDIYLKTEYDKTDVYLSLPSSASYEEEADKKEKKHYGTYVLSYFYDEEASEAKAMNKASETAARVGFMVLGEVEDGEHEDEVPEESFITNNPQYYYLTSNDVTEDDPDTEDVNEKNSNPFFIYEPNADSRSYVDKTDEEYNADLYIVGFKARTFSTTKDDEVLTYPELEGYYVQTYPVKLTAITAQKIMEYLVQEGDTEEEAEEKIQALIDREVLYNWLFTGQDIQVTDESTVPATVTDGTADGEVATFKPDNLLIQKTSQWKTEIIESETGIKQYQEITESTEETTEETEETGSTEETESTTEETESTTEETESTTDESTSEPETTYIQLSDLFNGTQVGKMGAFLKTEDISDLKYVANPKTTFSDLSALNQDYTAVLIDGADAEIGQDFRSQTKITTLKCNKPQKIRIYFWIEGQDIDCWNDIAGINFLVNLEFVGDVVERYTEETTETTETTE